MIDKVSQDVKTSKTVSNFEKVKSSIGSNVFGNNSEKKEDFTEKVNIVKSLLNSNYLMIAFFDKNLNYIEVSKAYADFWSKSPEEFIGKNYFDIFSNESGRRNIFQVIKSKKSHFFKEKKFNHPELGVTFWDWKIELIKNNSGKIVNIVFYLENATERKKNRKEVKRKSLALNILRKCNKAIIYSDNEANLLRDISQIISEKGKYNLVWKGFDKYNERKPYSFVQAQSRDKIDWFRNKISKSLGEYAEKIGVPNTAEKDFDKRKNCESGFSNSFELPISIDNQVIGKLCISKNKKNDSFSNEEKKLLNELSKNLSYGLQSLQEKQEKKHIEKRLTDLYRYLGVINRKISILMELERSQVKNGKQSQKKILNYILSSSINLSNAAVSALYKYDSNSRAFKKLSSQGLEFEDSKKLNTINEKDFQFQDTLNKFSANGRIQGNMEEIFSKDIKLKNNLKHFLLIPLILKKENQVKGFLLLGFSEEVNITFQELDFYEVLGVHISSALLNAEII